MLLIAAVVLACTRAPNDLAREHLTAALSDTLGKRAEPSVGFYHDPRHLQVSLSAARFPDSTETAFATEAREIAKFALARYENARSLDSITILDRKRLGDGVWKIRHTRTFGVDELGLAPHR